MQIKLVVLLVLVIVLQSMVQAQHRPSGQQKLLPQESRIFIEKQEDTTIFIGCSAPCSVAVYAYNEFLNSTVENLTPIKAVNGTYFFTKYLGHREYKKYGGFVTRVANNGTKALNFEYTTAPGNIDPAAVIGVGIFVPLVLGCCCLCACVCVCCCCCKMCKKNKQPELPVYQQQAPVAQYHITPVPVHPVYFAPQPQQYYGTIPQQQYQQQAQQQVPVVYSSPAVAAPQANNSVNNVQAASVVENEKQALLYPTVPQHFE